MLLSVATALESMNADRTADIVGNLTATVAFLVLSGTG